MRAILPGRDRRKLAGLALVLALAGCGGSSSKPAAEQRVAGEGFSFRAPTGWHVVRGPRSAQARSGDELVSVTIYRLVRPFRPELWDKVVPEVDHAAALLATREQGEVKSSETRRIAGRRARVYGIARSGPADERIAFVLAGRREYQLFCSGAEVACDRLLESFKLAA